MTKIKIVGGLIFIVSIILAVLFNHISQQNRLNSGLLDAVSYTHLTLPTICSV